MGSHWRLQRERICLEPGTIYFNTGSFAPLPKPVFEAQCDLRGRLARSPSDFLWRQMPPLLDEARRRLAEYVAADPADLLLMPNATAGINLVARSIKLDPGSEILMPDQEYGAMRFCWKAEARRHGWQVHEIELPWPTEDEDAIVDAIARRIGSKSKVLFFSHVTSPTGLVLPAARLCRLARESGLMSVIDGAHAPGMVPVDLAAIDADFYAGNCHKWMMAPSGAGFLHCRRELKYPLEPLLTSWGWDYDRTRPEEDSGWGGSYWARNLEFVGTQDRTAQLVLPQVLDFRAELGEEAAIAARTRELVDYVRARLTEIGLRPATPGSQQLSGAMTAFFVPALDLVEARDWIWKTHRIEAPFTVAAGHHYLRVSTAWFNTEEEIDRLAEAIQDCPRFKPKT